jgi:hypothetical protein
MIKKPVLDIGDLNEEFNLIKNELKYLNDRFMAISMDYQFYLCRDLGQHEIYKLRDNVNYRLFSAQLHIELLLRQHYIINQRFSDIYKKNPDKLLAEVYPSNPIHDYAEEEISSIFDSLVYHTVSVYDYLSTLTNFIFGQKNQETMTWTSLAISTRDKGNVLGQKSFSELIGKIDNDFVKKMYDHRSHLIHRAGQINKSNIRKSLVSDAFDISYFCTPEMTKQYSELRKIAKEKNITIKYGAFWLLTKTLYVISEILFALRHELSINPNPTMPRMAMIDEKNGTMKPFSETYWHESEFEQLKQRITQNSNQ